MREWNRRHYEWIRVERMREQKRETEMICTYDISPIISWLNEKEENGRDSEKGKRKQEWNRKCHDGEGAWRTAKIVRLHNVRPLRRIDRRESGRHRRYLILSERFVTHGRQWVNTTRIGRLGYDPWGRYFPDEPRLIGSVSITTSKRADSLLTGTQPLSPPTSLTAFW